MSDRLNTQSYFTRLPRSRVDKMATQRLKRVIQDQEQESRAGALFIERVAFAQCFLKSNIKERIQDFFKRKSQKY